MPCPSCGGAHRRSIAPGYWECTTLVDFPEGEKSAWDIWDPWRASINRKRPCGRHYQAGAVVSTEPCRCGIHSIGRCSRCDSPVCGIHGKLYADTLHCNECVRALFEVGQKEKREAAERAERVALAVREQLELSAREAMQRALEGLMSRRQLEPLATIRRAQTHRGPGGGAINWLAIDRRMGNGWYLGELNWARRDDEVTMSTRMVLAEDGRLLGSTDFGARVRPGRYFSFLRPKVIAVDGDEFDITQCANESLADLTAGLLEIAAGEPSIARWGLRS